MQYFLQKKLQENLESMLGWTGTGDKRTEFILQWNLRESIQTKDLEVRMKLDKSLNN